MTRLSRSILLTVAVVVTVSACTGTPTAQQATGLPDPARASSAADRAQSADPPATTSSPSTSAAPVSKAVISSTPTDGAAGASVLEPVVVRAANGTLQAVIVTNPEGREVTGALSVDGTTWSSAEPLGYGRTYQIDATAQDTAGVPTTSSASFTTVEPAGTIFPSFEPSPAAARSV